MKKLKLGKPTLLSISIQIQSILKSIHGGESEITKMKSHNGGTGNYLLAVYHTATDPELTQSTYFAFKRVNGCCDVWQEDPQPLRTIHNPRSLKKLRSR